MSHIFCKFITRKDDFAPFFGVDSAEERTFVSAAAEPICAKVILEAGMDFFDVVQERHSVRAYTSQTIEPGKLQQILEAANRAPSAGNLQAYEMYLVCDAKRKTALAKAARGQEFLAQASVILVFCAHAARSVVRYGKRGTDLYCLQDATIACTFAMLAATALGLSTVWVGAFDEDKVRRAIEAPDAHRPVAMLPVGYPAEFPRNSPRRSLDDLLHVEK